MNPMKKELPIPGEVGALCKTLRAEGFGAYLVGGCVRDVLLGREPKDWDVTTNAKPEKIQELFTETFYENDFGTVGAVTESTDPRLKVVEVTHYRIEGKYSDAPPRDGDARRSARWTGRCEAEARHSGRGSGRTFQGRCLANVACGAHFRRTRLRNRDENGRRHRRTSNPAGEDIARARTRRAREDTLEPAPDAGSLRGSKAGAFTLRHSGTRDCHRGRPEPGALVRRLRAPAAQPAACGR